MNYTSLRQAYDGWNRETQQEQNVRKQYKSVFFTVTLVY